MSQANAATHPPVVLYGRRPAALWWYWVAIFVGLIIFSWLGLVELSLLNAVFMTSFGCLMFLTLFHPSFKLVITLSVMFIISAIALLAIPPTRHGCINLFWKIVEWSDADIRWIWFVFCLFSIAFIAFDWIVSRWEQKWTVSTSVKHQELGGPEKTEQASDINFIIDPHCWLKSKLIGWRRITMKRRETDETIGQIFVIGFDNETDAKISHFISRP